MPLNLRVAQKVIVDLFGTGELYVGLAGRGEHPGVGSGPGIVVDDVFESTHPAVDSEQIEGRRSDEEYRVLVSPEKSTDLGDSVKSSGSEHAGYHRNPQALPVEWRFAVKNSLTLPPVLTWKQRGYRLTKET
jgi:hypothetical protein